MQSQDARASLAALATVSIHIATACSGDPIASPPGEALETADTTEIDRPESNPSDDTAPAQDLFQLQFSCDYLLDNRKSIDADYLDQHPECVQLSPAFHGRLGPVTIPSEGVDYEVFGLKREDTVVILQMGFFSDRSPANPFVQLSMSDTALQEGATVVIDPSDPRERLMVFHVGDDLRFDCMSAVGAGSVHVEVAQDIHASEGGKLSVTADDLRASSLNTVAARELRDAIEAEGRAVCEAHPGEPPGLDPDADPPPPICGGISEIGCCYGGVAYWCFNRAVMSITCSDDTTCGFGANGLIGCKQNPHPPPDGMALQCDPSTLPEQD